MGSSTDSELMLRYARDDAGAFDELYRRHRAAVYRYFARQVPREATDDLFQELWLRVIRTKNRYRPSGSFAAYLYTIAHNVLVDFYRRSARRADVLVAGPAVDTAGDAAGAPETVYASAALRRRLTAALDALPQPQREAFLLQQEGGLTLEEIGVVVGAGRETVKSRLRYALARLRSALANDRIIEEQRA